MFGTPLESDFGPPEEVDNGGVTPLWSRCIFGVTVLFEEKMKTDKETQDARRRDQFAMAALVGLLSDGFLQGEEDFERTARISYAVASAMMRERSKQK